MRNLTRAAILAGLLISPAPALRAQDKPRADGPASNREHALEVARKVMTEARFCTLATIGDHGEPQARVVDPLEPDAALVVYIATNPRSRKVTEIRKDPRVTLLYFDTVRSAYVTLIGVATEVPAAEKAAHRKKDWDAFFPASKAETYALYRIVPSRVELVSAKDGFSGDPATWRPEIITLK